MKYNLLVKVPIERRPWVGRDLFETLWSKLLCAGLRSVRQPRPLRAGATGLFCCARTAAALDRGEVTDKGSINQRAVLEYRAALVQELYAAQPSPRLISTNFKEKTP